MFKDRKTRVYYTGYLIILILYISSVIAAGRVSAYPGEIVLGRQVIPVASLTGVISSISHILVIFFALYYGRLGMITGSVCLAVELAMSAVSIFVAHEQPNLPRIFTTLVTVVTVIIIWQNNRKIKKLREAENKTFREQQRLSEKLFVETATALVNAIDAKDPYSHGHSLRVAEYSEKIARMMGKSEEECYRIYHVALLHDVGKIGIDDNIINKKGKLTPEEYEVIKQHPVKGEQILSSISEYPYLSIGAHYHHERYDGKGYPDGLKGEDIPEIARIISVADAYDAMTSNRSYRNAIPQQLVREEIVKGAGTQFDPEIAKIMQHLIDIDVEYQMKERNSVKEFAGKNELVCKEFMDEVSDGMLITDNITKISLKYTCEADYDAEDNGPVILLFDSLDGKVHKSESTKKDLNYTEYCRIWFDGRTECGEARKIKTDVINEIEENEDVKRGENSYYIEAVKWKDHVLVMIDDGKKMVNVTVALPDSTRFAYIGLTGEHCIISDVGIVKLEDKISEGFITRIAGEISYIEGNEGDIPNVQIDSYRTDATIGIPITDGLRITFHTKSLPTARLIWHCAYLDIFYSEDRKVGGKAYRDFTLVRLDGENWVSEGDIKNRMIVNRTSAFESWDEWKRANREGFDCTVEFMRRDGRIVVTTENLGISIKDVVTISDDRIVYVALTGDQCAITNIRIG